MLYLKHFNPYDKKPTSKGSIKKYLSNIYVNVKSFSCSFSYAYLENLSIFMCEMII